jgi:methionine-rich copper-binding protein CopC
MRRIASLAALGLLLTSSAWAHTHLAKSDPADGSTLAKAPEHIALQFEHPVRITEFTIQKGTEKSEKLLMSLPEASGDKISAPAPQLSAGQYVVNWRAVSSDGHVMSGKVRFTVSGGASSAAASGKPKEPSAH